VIASQLATTMALPPVALPPLNNIVNLPPQPQNPPVASDVVASHKYMKDIVVAHGETRSDCSSAVSAYRYVGM